MGEVYCSGFGDKCALVCQDLILEDDRGFIFLQCAEIFFIGHPSGGW